MKFDLSKTPSPFLPLPIVIGSSCYIDSPNICGKFIHKGTHHQVKIISFYIILLWIHNTNKYEKQNFLAKFRYYNVCFLTFCTTNFLMEFPSCHQLKPSVTLCINFWFCLQIKKLHVFDIFGLNMQIGCIQYCAVYCCFSKILYMSAIIFGNAKIQNLLYYINIS